MPLASGASQPKGAGSRLPVWGFTYVIRGTPMLVQLFLLYYGLAQFEAVRSSVLWPWLSSAWFCAVLSFAINTCAYTTEIIAGAMRTMAPGEIEAARSLGMTPWTRAAPHRAAVGPAAQPAGLQQRGDHDAARHLARQRGDACST